MQVIHPDPATSGEGSTAATVSHTRRSIGVVRGLGIGALCLVSAGAGAALISGGSVLAADTTVPAATSGANDAAGDNQVIIDVVKAVSPAVVTLNVTLGGTSVQDPNGLGNGPQGFVQQGTGSGVIIDPSGLILTNHHVVQDASTVSVVLADGRTFDGKVAGIDTFTDLAFVKIDATGLPTAQLGDSSAIQLGQLAIAMGDPLGQFPGSVTSGIVSGLDRTVVVSDTTGQSSSRLVHLIQTDAAINPGNSGGPLLDGDGKIIGIDTAQAGSAQGIGFAIPIDLAKPIITQVQAGQAIARPYIGIRYLPLDAQIAKDNKLSVSDGAWVHTEATQGQTATTPIVADGPAAKAGLKDGDIITAIAGQAIDQAHPLDLVLLSHAPGDVVTLTVLRDGASTSVDVTLGTRPADLGQ
jgi:S1-C subfamily serine protease